MDEMWMLETIQRSDPDGGQVQPTEADYAAHREWAVKAFGQAVWDRYIRGGWGYQSEV